MVVDGLVLFLHAGRWGVRNLVVKDALGLWFHLYIFLVLFYECPEDTYFGIPIGLEVEAVLLSKSQMKIVIIECFLSNSDLPSGRIQRMDLFAIAINPLIEIPPLPDLINDLLDGSLLDPLFRLAPGLYLHSRRGHLLSLMPDKLRRLADPPDPEVDDLLLEVLVLEETILFEGVVSDENEHFAAVVPVEDLRVVDWEP